MISGVTVVTTLVCLFFITHEAAGASRARHSLRPLIFWADGSLQKLGRIAPRERGVLFWKLGQRHCEERSEEAIHSSICGANYGLLRGACHRARVRATRWLAMTVLWLPLDLSLRGMVVSLIVCGLPKLATPGDAPGSAFVNLNRRYVDLRLKSGISHEY